MSLLPDKLKLEAWRGSTFRVTMTLYQDDETGPVRDLTGYTALLEVRPEKGNQTVLMTLTDANGGIIITPPTNEVQTVTLTGTPTGGTFTISWNGQGPTSAIAYDADGAAVTTALESLTNVSPGDIVATGAAGGPWTLTFGGTYAATDVPEVTCDGSLLTGGTTPDAVPATTTEGLVGGVLELYADVANIEAQAWTQGIYDLTITAPGGDTDALFWGPFVIRGVD